MDFSKIDLEDNLRRRQNGQLYFAFTTDQIMDRRRCRLACEAYNNAGDVTRRRLVELFQAISLDKTPLPPPAPTRPQDAMQLNDFVWCDGPIKMDFGYNVKFGDNVYVNSNSTWVDTCTITVGSRTLIGPNCSFYSGTHPVCPIARSGTRGPEGGAPISIGEDCWLGGNVIVLPGVSIGRGCTIGAGSVVTKNIPELSVAVGNPARVVRKVTKVPLEELPPGFNPYDGQEEATETNE